MNQSMQYYEKLCLSLNITGWQRFRLIEYPLLKAPLKYALALATTLSLGDFTAIALFGSPDFYFVASFGFINKSGNIEAKKRQ